MNILIKTIQDQNKLNGVFDHKSFKIKYGLPLREFPYVICFDENDGFKINYAKNEPFISPDEAKLLKSMGIY